MMRRRKMPDEKEYGLDDAKQQVREEAVSEYKERNWSRGLDIYDLAHEIADTHVPVYTSTILQWGVDNLELATEEPDLGPAFDGSPTPVNIIAANIYEVLRNEAIEAIQELQEEDDWEDEGDSEN
jgi:hypothetical protein